MNGKRLVITIPFPTTAAGRPWPNEDWIEYTTRAAFNAATAWAMGSGAIFNDVKLDVVDDGSTT